VVAPELLARHPELSEPQALSALPWVAISTFYQHEVTLQHQVDGQLGTTANSTDTVDGSTSAPTRIAQSILSLRKSTVLSFSIHSTESSGYRCRKLTSGPSRLILRTTHAMKLTDDGERCYQHARRLVDSWLALEDDLRIEEDRPVGVLRVRAPHAFGRDCKRRLTVA
jgi:hypothetical protein